MMMIMIVMMQQMPQPAVGHGMRVRVWRVEMCAYKQAPEKK